MSGRKPAGAWACFSRLPYRSSTTARGPRRLAKLGQLKDQGSAVERASQIGECLPFDDGDQGTVGGPYAVVTGPQCRALSCCLLLREPIRVLLAAVDDDEKLGDTARPATRDASARSRRRDDFAGLPEDALPSRRQGREDELGTVLSRPVEDQVDGHASPRAERDGNLLDDLGFRWPAVVHPGAEDSARPGPGVADLQDQTAVDRQPDEVRQPRVRIRVPGDDEVHVESLRLASRSVGR